MLVVVDATFSVDEHAVSGSLSFEEPKNSNHLSNR